MPNWKKAETIGDYVDAAMTAIDIASRTLGKMGVGEKVKEAATVLKEKSEKKAEDYADYLKDETKVASLVAGIPDNGKKKALRRWLNNLKLNRKRSHVQVVLSFAQMTLLENGDKITTDYLSYLATLGSDDDRNAEMVAYGFMRPKESDYFGSHTEDVALRARIMVSAFLKKNFAAGRTSPANLQLKRWGKRLKRHATGNRRSRTERMIDVLFN